MQFNTKAKENQQQNESQQAQDEKNKDQPKNPEGQKPEENQGEKQQNQSESKPDESKEPQKPLLQGQMAKQDALRILDALKETEQELQGIRRPIKKSEEREPEKDW